MDILEMFIVKILLNLSVSVHRTSKRVELRHHILSGAQDMKQP